MCLVTWWKSPKGRFLSASFVTAEVIVIKYLMLSDEEHLDGNTWICNH